MLIVDDEPGIRESLTGVLEDEGFEAHAVATGAACLEEAARSDTRWCCWTSGCRTSTDWKC